MKFEYWLAFFIYFIILFCIAVGFRKKNASGADILIGNRTLNFWVTGLSAQASDMSSWLFMAFPMSVFLGGIPQIWIAISLVLGMWCTWQFIAIRLRIETEKHNSYTLSTFFSSYFKDSTGTIRVLTALLCLFFLTYYLSAGLISMGFLFESLFNFDYVFGVTLATVVMVGYTFIGGYVSVAWADLFQALFLLLAIIIVPILAYFEIGGLASIQEAAHIAEIPLTLISSKSQFAWQDIVYLFFGWGLGYFGMPHIVTKFMGIKNAQELRKAKYLGLAWQILTLIAAASVGLIGISYFSAGISNPELVFIEMVKELFHPLSAGFVLCGIIAATISTMDSQILVAASMLTEDLYKYLIAPKAQGKQEVKIFRISVIAIALVAFSISLGRDKTIMDTVYYAWSGLGCSFSPLMLTTLYYKRATAQGAIAGIITGGIIAALWPTVNTSLSNHGIIGSIPSMVPGFFLSLVMIFIVSFLTQKKVTQ